MDAEGRVPKLKDRNVNQEIRFMPTLFKEWVIFHSE